MKWSGIWSRLHDLAALLPSGLFPEGTTKREVIHVFCLFRRHEGFFRNYRGCYEPTAPRQKYSPKGGASEGRVR